MRKIAIALLVFSTCALADPLAYVTTNTGEFGTMNIATGVFSEIATEPTILNGLAWGSNSQLYGLDSSGNLVTIDPLTGVETLVGSTGLDASTNTFAGLTDGALYALDASNNLYSINPTTGAATLVGATGVPPIDSTDFTTPAYSDSLMGDGSQLYVSEQIFGVSTLSETLYTVNPSNAGTTTVGPLAEDSFVGGGYLGGSYYLFSADTGNGIYTVNPSTGATNFVVDGQVGVYSAVDAVPEPRTLGLVLVGLLMAFAIVRQQMRRRAIDPSQYSA